MRQDRGEIPVTDNVVNLADRRRSRDEAVEGTGLIYCPCGDAWWVLKRGAVNFAPDLRITGWTGDPVCNSCGNPMRSPS